MITAGFITLSEGVRGVFPLDPPLEGGPSWDALNDSLWGGLDSLKDDRIVIVWPDASHMRAYAPDEYAIATNVLAELPGLLSDGKVTAGPTKQLLVLQSI
jgi:hypothetical protein